MILSPSLNYIVLATVGYLVYSILYQIVYCRFFHPLAKFPGPFMGSITRLWITYQNALGREVEACQDQHRRHGQVIRVTPTMLHINDATRLPLIYHRSADKSLHYITGSTGLTESIFNMQDHKTHARYRKIAATPYSFSNIKRMEPLIDAQISHWISRLDDLFASTGKAFDFCPWAIYMAFDVVSEVGFGRPFGFIAEGRDIGGLIQGMHDGLLPFGIMARMYPLTYWLKSTWLGKYFVATPADDNGFGKMMQFRDALVAKRLEDLGQGHKSRVDILQTFLDARDENDQPLPLEYVKPEILIVLIAGADTTGTAFQGLMENLLNNPDIYAKVMEEIKAADKADKFSDLMPSYEEVLEHCPYYVACVHETMRLTPAAPSIFPRLVPRGGFELDGKYVPEGTEVTANPYLVNRDPQIYGLDADMFRPERWLESKDKAQEYTKYSMTFGYGSRSCLGQYVAKMEIYKAPIQLLRTFEVARRDERQARYTVKGGMAHFEDLWVTIKKRGY